MMDTRAPRFQVPVLVAVLVDCQPRNRRKIHFQVAAILIVKRSRHKVRAVVEAFRENAIGTERVVQGPRLLVVTVGTEIASALPAGIGVNAGCRHIVRTECEVAAAVGGQRGWTAAWGRAVERR